MKPCPFCGSEARIYGNSSYRVGTYAQARCKNEACRARGPLAAVPQPFTSWAEENALPDWAARVDLRKAKDAAARAEVRAAAERAWNGRAGTAPYQDPPCGAGRCFCGGCP